MRGAIAPSYGSLLCLFYFEESRFEESRSRWCRIAMTKAVMREFTKPFILIPFTMASDSIMVQAFTIKLKRPKVMRLKGRVNKSRMGFTSRLARNRTKPITNREGMLLMVIEGITLDRRKIAATADIYFNRSFDMIPPKFIVF